MTKILFLFFLVVVFVESKKIELKIKKKIYFTKPIVMETYTIEVDNQMAKPLSKFKFTINKDNFEYLKSIKISELGILLNQTEVIYTYRNRKETNRIL